MKKGRYHFTLFKRKSGLKKGVYYYYCYDSNGNRIKRSTGTTSRTAALEIITERIVTGTIIEDKLHHAESLDVITFAEFSKNFYTDDCPICKDKAFRGKPYTPAVIKGERQRLVDHIKPFFDKLYVKDIKVATLKKWQIWMREKGQSNASINRVRVALLHIFDYAIECGFMELNPAQKVKPLYIDPKTVRDAYTQEEVDKLFAEPWENKLVMLACKTAALTGMRMGEIRALKPSAIKDGIITISSAIDHHTGIIKCTKSGKVRQCPIPQSLEEELLAISKDDWIFTLNGSTPIASSFINKGLNEKLKELNIARKGLCFHSFRHYFNSRLVASGVNGELIRAVVGHESEKMTDHYLHLNNSKDYDAIRDIQKALLR